VEGVSLLASVHAPITLWKVTSQIAAVVKYTGYLDYAIAAAAIEKKMPRLFHSQATHSAPAELKVIGPRALDHDVRTFS